MRASIVAADSNARTVTVRDLTMGDRPALVTEEPKDKTTASSVTLRVDPKAAGKLTDLRPGDTVTLTCRASASGSLGAGMGATETGMTGNLDSQLLADQHCSTVTAIRKAR
jgi:hypothetical protein